MLAAEAEAGLGTHSTNSTEGGRKAWYTIPFIRIVQWIVVILLPVIRFSAEPTPISVVQGFLESARRDLQDAFILPDRKCFKVQLK